MPYITIELKTDLTNISDIQEKLQGLQRELEKLSFSRKFWITSESIIKEKEEE